MVVVDNGEPVVRQRRTQDVLAQCGIRKKINLGEDSRINLGGDGRAVAQSLGDFCVRGSVLNHSRREAIISSYFGTVVFWASDLSFGRGKDADEMSNPTVFQKGSHEHLRERSLRPEAFRPPLPPTVLCEARLHQLDSEEYLRDILRVLPYWPSDRYLELAPKYWSATRATLDPTQLVQEIGPLTIPPMK